MSCATDIRVIAIIVGFAFSAATPPALAAGFNSGSTGADGAFTPTASTTLTLPPSGIFNFTTVNIPTGVIVKFAKNAANTPVTILATGDVTIAGTLDVSGGDALSISNTSPLGDRSLPGLSGNGGFDGGRGGAPEVNRRAGSGLGPGAGGGGDAVTTCCASYPQGGGGGGYSAAGSNNAFGAPAGNTGLSGGIYGSNLLTPLVGGSGGGGGAGSALATGTTGTGGGGGAGAILIASSGSVNLTGTILAKGGNGGNLTSLGSGANGVSGSAGGGGSGGAIRIIASNVIGAGTLNVNGGAAGTSTQDSGHNGGAGGRGRSSIEIATTGTLSIAGIPTLSITSVGGFAAPATPTGTGDIALPEDTPNPATVSFATSGVPLGNTVKLTLTPARGAATTVTSTPLAGSTASATASASINVPLGPSTLTASTSYTITVAMGDALRHFAGNERVERINLTATLGGKPKATLITVSGKEYEAPAEALRIAAPGG